MRISDFIEKTNEVPSLGALYDLFLLAIGDEEYSRLAFMALTPSAREALPGTTAVPKPAIFFNYPTDFARHYEVSGYVDIDPILLSTPRRTMPFLWGDVLHRSVLTTKQQQLFREANDAGLRGGVAIPVHGPQGQSYGIYLASESPEPESRQGLARLQVLGFQLFATYCRLTEGCGTAEADDPLSDRERECLLWTARGKSAWEIGMILGLSEHTITFYLKNAMKKLNTRSRVLAVVKAIQGGQIQP